MSQLICTPSHRPWLRAHHSPAAPWRCGGPHEFQAEGAQVFEHLPPSVEPYVSCCVCPFLPCWLLLEHCVEETTFCPGPETCTEKEGEKPAGMAQEPAAVSWTPGTVMPALASPQDHPSLSGRSQVPTSLIPASWSLDPSCKLEPACRVGCSRKSALLTACLPEKALQPCPSHCSSLPQTPLVPGAIVCGCCPCPSPKPSGTGGPVTRNSVGILLCPVSAGSLCSTHSIRPNAQSGIGKHKGPV